MASVSKIMPIFSPKLLVGLINGAAYTDSRALPLLYSQTIVTTALWKEFDLALKKKKTKIYVHKSNFTLDQWEL